MAPCDVSQLCASRTRMAVNEMSLFFSILINLLIIAAIAAQYIFMGYLVMGAESRGERYIRVLAYSSGVLTVLGAKALGASIPAFLVNSLSNPSPIIMGLVGVLLPAAAGVAMAWYFVRAIQKSKNIATRLLIFIGVLVATQFADVYAAIVRTSGLALNPALAPNISFIVGVTLYIMLNFDPDWLTPVINRRA